MKLTPFFLCSLPILLAARADSPKTPGHSSPAAISLDAITDSVLANLFETRLIPKARQVLETNRTTYESGRTGFLELVLSDRTLRETQAMYQQHLADYQVAVAELEALVGADLHLFSARKETSKRKTK